MHLRRYLYEAVKADLAHKMVFVSGPRQVGKTTLGFALLGTSDRQHPAYLSWDDVRVRPRIRAGELPPDAPLIILDEVHKYARWRGLVKGLYDSRTPGQAFLVTGSARLDVHRRGGDSLHGRYRAYRLHPLSLSELGGSADACRTLLRFGGFPEPFLQGTERAWRRWQAARLDRVLREDVRDLERVRELSLIEVLAEALPTRVGAPLSVRKLRQELEVAHETAERWLQILENLHYCYRIAPFVSPRIRAVKKERKLYLWDWSLVANESARFENMVASHLLKYCHFREDADGHEMELRFLRDTDGREVDFVVLENRRPLFAVEVKAGEGEPSSSVSYFKARTGIPRFFQTHLGEKDVRVDGVRILPFAALCRELELP